MYLAVWRTWSEGHQCLSEIHPEGSLERMDFRHLPRWSPSGQRGGRGGGHRKSSAWGYRFVSNELLSLTIFLYGVRSLFFTCGEVRASRSICHHWPPSFLCHTPSIFYKRWRKFFARPISYEFQPFCVAPSLKWPLIFEKNLLGHLLFTKSS